MRPAGGRLRRHSAGRPQSHTVTGVTAGELAAARARGRSGALAMRGPNPRYSAAGGKTGGSGRADTTPLLASLDRNHLGGPPPRAWVIFGTPARRELTGGLPNTCCRTD